MQDPGTVTVIIPWSNDEFIQQACKCAHPFDSLPMIDEEMSANFRGFLAPLPPSVKG